MKQAQPRQIWLGDPPYIGRGNPPAQRLAVRTVPWFARRHPGSWHPVPGGRVARRSRTPRRGRRGLIGMLLSIVVAVVIVIAIFAVYNQLTAAANAAQTALFVRQLAPQISSEYRGDYADLDNAAAISSGFVPDNWRNGNAIRSPDGIAVTVRGSGADSGIHVITFVGGVATGTCKAILGALKSDHQFSAARIGGTLFEHGNLDTPAEINNHCAGSQRADLQLRFS